jgi:hypothetical protein
MMPEVRPEDELNQFLKSRLAHLRTEKKGTLTKIDDRHVRAEWGSLDKPVLFSKLSKWIPQDSADWALSVGVYVYPKRHTREDGIVILAPALYRALKTNLPEDKDLNAQDIAMGIMTSLITFKPNFEPSDLVKAFALVSSEIGLQFFPHLLRIPKNTA